MTIESDLEALAAVLANAGLAQMTPLPDKLEIFKLLTNYQFHKNNPNKPGKEDDDGTSFANFRERVEAASGIGEGDPN